MADSCPACGVDLRPEARFCTNCGTPTAPPTLITAPVRDPPARPPAPPRRSTTTVVVAAVAAVAVLAGLGVAVAFFVQRESADAGPRPVGPTTTIAAPGTTVPVTTTGPTATVTDAAESLDNEVAADRVTAESVVGAWVPQISSKAAGLVVDGVTYDETLIWRDFMDARGTRPDAFLVRSGDYSSFKRAGFWVTLVAQPFSSADAANAWCAQAGLPTDGCFAKRLSHTDGPAGNTVPR